MKNAVLAGIIAVLIGWTPALAVPIPPGSAGSPVRARVAAPTCDRPTFRVSLVNGSTGVMEFGVLLHRRIRWVLVDPGSTTRLAYHVRRPGGVELDVALSGRLVAGAIAPDLRDCRQGV